MKTTIDKIDVNPPHAFSPQEFRSFLGLLPKELLQDVEMVRLSNAIDHSATSSVASFSLLEKRLVIVSRGKQRRDVMLEVIQCLARANLRRPGEKKFKQLPAAEILSYSNKMVDELEPMMPVPPHWNLAELRYAHPPTTKTLSTIETR